MKTRQVHLMCLRSVINHHEHMAGLQQKLSPANPGCQRHSGLDCQWLLRSHWGYNMELYCR